MQVFNSFPEMQAGQQNGAQSSMSIFNEAFPKWKLSNTDTGSMRNLADWVEAFSDHANRTTDTGYTPEELSANLALAEQAKQRIQADATKLIDIVDDVMVQMKSGT